MKKTLFIAMAALVCMSCASKKQVAQQPVQQPAQQPTQIKAGIEVEIPCIEVSFDDEVYFRELGIGTHEGNNPQLCRYAAVDAAKGMIKKRLGEFIQGVTTFYTGNYAGSKDKNALEGKTMSKLNGVVEKMLNDADKVCEKQIIDTKGNINWYYVISIPKSDLKKNIMDVLSQDEKEGIDFHEYQMQKFIDEKMEQMLEAKKNAGY